MKKFIQGHAVRDRWANHFKHVCPWSRGPVKTGHQDSLKVRVSNDRLCWSRRERSNIHISVLLPDEVPCFFCVCGKYRYDSRLDFLTPQTAQVPSQRGPSQVNFISIGGDFLIPVPAPQDPWWLHHWQLGRLRTPLALKPCLPFSWLLLPCLKPFCCKARPIIKWKDTKRQTSKKEAHHVVLHSYWVRKHREVLLYSKH